MADADRGLMFDADNLKVGEYLDRWLSDSVSGTVKATTFERYEQITRLHLKPALGRMKLKALTPPMSGDAIVRSWRRDVRLAQFVTSTQLYTRPSSRQ
jgi:hypothetical protein